MYCTVILTFFDLQVNNPQPLFTHHHTHLKPLFIRSFSQVHHLYLRARAFSPVRQWVLQRHEMGENEAPQALRCCPRQSLCLCEEITGKDYKKKKQRQNERARSRMR
jgi:hypothetical protein